MRMNSPVSQVSPCKFPYLDGFFFSKASPSCIRINAILWYMIHISSNRIQPLKLNVCAYINFKDASDWSKFKLFFWCNATISYWYVKWVWLKLTSMSPLLDKFNIYPGNREMNATTQDGSFDFWCLILINPSI